MPQPVDPRVLGVTVAGGVIGVFARALVVAPVDDPAAVPWVTLGINVAGSLILGIVVGWLDDRRPLTRAFLGTGIMGGFTTYSAFAVATALWITTPLLAAGLAAASVVAGVGGALAGLFLGRRIADRPGRIELPEDAE
ncbi:CrcB family protein [Microbacterium sp. QXD-8]|uniref:Fluoride-specific ion channel FluC n=1 Tax=Microbacterium psychrotolerans TaxID=3068321 RepID=A0ABU0YYB2_9MICO|nr:CrcB family protein [Microbacterium sp. QXD-8]MDQ7876750.1 CrcB family protein [Microbacterium sp. QXD-8]